MEQHIHLTDWQRLLVGKSGWVFLAQVAARAALTYMVLMVAMRLLGKRVSAQLTLFELSVIVTLAAAIGVPLEVAENGMLPAIVVVAMAIILNRGLAYVSLRRAPVDRVITGTIMLLVEDGRMLLPSLKSGGLSREKIFAELRKNSIWQLGNVARLFIEPSGQFALIRAHGRKPGLSIIPGIDAELRGSSRLPGWFSCASCGWTRPADQLPSEPCRYCGSNRWTEATTGEII